MQVLMFPLYTCNGADINKGGVTSGTLPTINGGNTPEVIKKKLMNSMVARALI